MRELLVLPFNGVKYGVWKDEILSIKDIETIHRLPLSPTCIAGMSILDGRTVTLADLSVCIGFPPITREKNSRILLMSDQEKVTGFVIEGELETLSIADGSVFPLPDFLKTQVVDTCALRGSDLIPLININHLYARVLKADREPAMADFLVSPTRQADVSSLHRVRIFESGGEFFAASSEAMKNESIKPGAISNLALMPHFVKGVLYYNGRILTVIDLAKAMNISSKQSAEIMLVCDIGSDSFGFLVNSDRGALLKNAFTIKPLPLLAQSEWLRFVVLHNGELLPFIEAAALLAPGSDHTGGLSSPHYITDSQFSIQFGKQDIDVVEFSLLGARHAIPKSEVEDILPFKPYRSLPNVLPIVAGVAEHNGELLPVLDLARCFGRRSRMTPGWRMALVKNGEFRALVATEAVFGERRILQDRQRAVPIVLPHHVVYGCYPDESGVRLILNVEALTVHFDTSAVKEFFGSMILKEPAESGEFMVSQESEEPEKFLVTQESPSPEESKEFIVSHAYGKSQEFVEPEALLMAEVSKEIVERSSVGNEKPQEVIEQSVDEEVTIQTSEQAMVEELKEELPEIVATPPQPEQEQEPEPVSEPITQTESIAQRHIEHEPASIAPETVRNEPEEFEATEESKEPEGPTGVTEEHLESEVPAQNVISEDHHEVTVLARQTEEQTIPISGTTTIIPPEINKAEPEYEQIIPKPISPQIIVESVPSDAGQSSIHPEPVSAREKRTKWFIPAGIAAAIVMALYWLGTMEKPIEKKAERSPEIIVAEKPGPSTDQPVRKPATAAPPQPLILKVPQDMPLEVDVYFVKKGDTLWAISKRFTGNPLNYPSVANENKITNPHLIFPGQKIQLKK